MKKNDKKISEIFKLPEEKVKVKDIKVSDQTHQINTGGPELGENDLYQSLATSETNTTLQTSPDSPQLQYIEKAGNLSTKPYTGTNQTLINVGTKFTDTAANQSYTNFMSNGMVDINSTSFVLSLITYFKQIHLSKFKYEGMDGIDTLLLEERLWLYGRVCIYELDKKYILPFDIVEIDLNGEPLAIRPKLPNNSKLLKKNIKFPILKGKDMVYFINDYNGYFEKMESYSPLFRHWWHIQTLSGLQIEILNNAYLSKTRLMINVKGQTDLEVQAFLKQWNSGSPIVFGDFAAMISRITKGDSSLNESQLDIVDRTELLWLNFHNLLKELKTFMGLEVNDGIDKKERMITDEVNKADAPNKLSLNTELKLREQGTERTNLKFGLKAKVTLNCYKEEIEKVEEGGEL